MTRSVLTICLLCSSTALAIPPDGVAFRDLVDLRWLMYVQPGKTVQVSSFDRTGGNDDGFSGKFSALRQDENGGFVIMESDRPGAIVQVWFTGYTGTGRIRFYFDSAATPAVDMTISDFFSGTVYPFVPPLAGNDEMSSGGFVSYVPMAFSKACRVTTTDRVKFYHIDYRVLNDAGGIETFSLPLSGATKGEFDSVLAALGRRGSDLPGTLTPVRLMPGKSTKMFSDAGRHYIRQLVVKPDAPDPGMLKRVIVRMFWDNAHDPAVEVPLLDLFGDGFRPATYRSVPSGVTPAGWYLNFPMPYRQGARIEMENGNASPVLLHWSVETAPLPVERDSDLVFFHARFRQDTTRLHMPVDLLITEGRGHYVGGQQTMQSFPGAIYVEGGTKSRIDYLEGDERIYVDGEALPSWHGTGTEDYYNGGWYFNRGTFGLPFHGLTEKNEEAGSISVYRYHVTDMIPFANNVHAAIEHGHNNERPGVYYSSVAFWYQQPQVPSALHLAASTLAIPTRILWKEKSHMYLADTLSLLKPVNAGVSVVPWEKQDPSWKGIRDVVITPKKSGARVGMPINAAINWEYDISLGYSATVSGAKVRFSLNDKALDDGVDTRNPYFLPGRVWRDTVRLNAGSNSLVTGIDPQPAGSTLSLTTLDVVPMPRGTLVRHWKLIGPFDNPSNTNKEREFGPEADSAWTGEYPGKDGEVLSWTDVDAEANGTVSLVSAFHDSQWGIAYAGVRVYSPVPRTTFIAAGTDDGVKVWVNGDLVWSNLVSRGVVIDQDRMLVALRPGWNTIVMKITQGVGAWGFCLRIPEFEGRRIEGEDH